MGAMAAKMRTDGLEGLWYVRLHEKKFGRLPEIPDSVVRDLRHYSIDPYFENGDVDYGTFEREVRYVARCVVRAQSGDCRTTRSIF